MQGRLSNLRKFKAAVLLLAVVLMMVNTCPVRSLLTTAFSPSTETSRSADEATFVYQDLGCSESKLSKASFVDFSKSADNSLPLPFFLTVISLYLSLSILGSRIHPSENARSFSLTEQVPLFLRNRSIII